MVRYLGLEVLVGAIEGTLFRVLDMTRTSFKECLDWFTEGLCKVERLM